MRLSMLLAGLTPAWAQAQKAPRLAKYSTERFLLTAGPCAANRYFVTIQSASFINAQGSGFPLPCGHTLRGSWGASGASWLVGDERQAVPERLKILWFAYAEDKLYRGDFALPQEEIHNLLKAGYWDQAKNSITRH